MAEYYYRLYGCILKSEIPYEQLVGCEKNAGFTTEEKEKMIFLYQGDLCREVLLQYGQGKVLDIKADFIWFSNQYGIFQISQGREIRIMPHEQVPLTKLTSFVFGYCIAMLFWQRGQLAVHCSAVSYNGKALLIAGGSGSGKSTLTHCFLENQGILMCDDVAIIEIGDTGTKVYPAFPMQKLCQDAAVRNNLDTQQLLCVDEDRDKYALPYTGSFSTEPVELGAVICLGRAVQQECSIGRITGHESLKAILDNLFLKPMFENSYPFPPEDMLRCLTLAGQVPVYKLLRPMEGNTVEAQRRLILEQLEGQA